MTGAMANYFISAVSSDRLTLFVEGGGDYFTYTFSRAHVSQAFTGPDPNRIGMQTDYVFRAHVNGACTELWTGWAPGGCFREDTHKMTRCTISCPSGQCSSNVCVNA